MENKVGATNAQLFEDFEPLCQRHLDQDRETLAIHLPQFKKEQLKVQVNNHGVLKISGERPIDATKTSRFYKEVKIAKECDPNSIHAKFVNGILSIVMLKKANQSTQQNQQKNAGDTAKSEEVAQKPSAQNASSGGEKAVMEAGFKQKVSNSKLTLAAEVAIAMIVLALVGYYLLHIYRSTIVED